MPELTVRIKKKNDGSAALSCIRSDGTTTWQQQNRASGRFFPLNDLTHMAVETTLGFRRAFYGLVSEGWDISTFSGPTADARLPPEALLAELIVGLMDVERATGEPSNAEEFNWKIQAYFRDTDAPVPSFRIADEQLAAIRAKRAELFAQWDAVADGGTLDVSFTRPPVPDTNGPSHP
jgi:hypothetical protein